MLNYVLNKIEKYRKLFLIVDYYVYGETLHFLGV